MISVVVAVTPSSLLISSVDAVTPSSLFNSDVDAVIPSKVCTSAAVKSAREEAVALGIVANSFNSASANILLLTVPVSPVVTSVPVTSGTVIVRSAVGSVIASVVSFPSSVAPSKTKLPVIVCEPSLLT